LGRKKIQVDKIKRIKEKPKKISSTGALAIRTPMMAEGL
jgi:hypothetical protein